MKTEIGKNTLLKTGDIIEMHINRAGQSVENFDWVEMGYLSIIEWRLDSNPQYEVMSRQLLPGEAVYTIRIKDQGQQIQKASISAAMIWAGVLIIGGIVSYFVLGKVYKITQSLPDVLQTTTAKLGGVSLLLFAIAYLYLTIKKRKS